jgi:outer membrane protein
MTLYKIILDDRVGAFLLNQYSQRIFTKVFRVSFLCLLLIFSSNSLAEQTLPKWEFGLGPALLSYPDYPGSKEQNQLLIPLPYIVYRGEDFSINQQAITKPFLKTPTVELDLSLSGSIPVSSKDNKKRTGMEDLDGSIGLGPVLKYQLYQHQLNELKFELPIRAIIASDFKSIHQEGWVANPGIFYYYRDDFTQKQRIKLTVGATANFADAQNHNYYYGVDSDYATLDRPAYKTTDGFSGMSYHLALNYHFDQFWLGGFWRGLDMSQAVYKESPLVETQFSNMFGLTLTWNFMKSVETVKGLE